MNEQAETGFPLAYLITFRSYGARGFMVMRKNLLTGTDLMFMELLECFTAKS
jgi:hypothetical protein